MTGTAIAALPTTGDRSLWTAQEAALVEAAGLTRTEGRGANASQVLAPRPTVEAFLQHCQRTGLDPIARQIYAIYRGGKWGIQISIDGARLVAERSGRYEGQTTPEFTADGTNWTQVWLSNEQPRAARVGVYKTGFREPQYAVALWEAYAVYQDEWSNGSKTGNQILSAMWAKMGPLMLAKCAEMLALRKAFPQDLSGLYSTEEMDQAGAPREVVREAEKPAAAAPAQATIATAESTRDWVAEAEAIDTVAALTALAEEAERAGEIGRVIGALRKRKAELEQPAQQPLVDVPPQQSTRRRWVAEARSKRTRAEVLELMQQAIADGALAQVIEELEAIAGTLPDPSDVEPEPAGSWPVAEIPQGGGEWVEDGNGGWIEPGEGTK